MKSKDNPAPRIPKNITRPSDPFTNMVRPTGPTPPTDERRFMGLRPTAPVSPTIYDGIRKVDPTYKNPKVTIGQNHVGIEQLLANQANKLLVERYGDPREIKKGNPLAVTGDSSSHNALGHATTAMVLARKAGWPLANIAGLGHELMVGLLPDGNLLSKETVMDIRNNLMGSLAGMAPTEKDSMDIIDYLYKNKWIQTLNPPSSIKLPTLPSWNIEKKYMDILDYMVKMVGLNNAKRKTSRR